MHHRPAALIQADEHWMKHALALASQAEVRGEVPVGAVLVRSGTVIGSGYNSMITLSDPTAHAEVVALRSAAETIGNYRLVDTTLYVTVEPCTMCAGALVHARVTRLVYGAPELRAGAVRSSARVLDNPGLNHRVEVTDGVMAGECGALISRFFKARRRQ